MRNACFFIKLFFYKKKKKILLKLSTLSFYFHVKKKSTLEIYISNLNLNYVLVPCHKILYIDIRKKTYYFSFGHAFASAKKCHRYGVLRFSIYSRVLHTFSFKMCWTIFVFDRLFLCSVTYSSAWKSVFFMYFLWNDDTLKSFGLGEKCRIP